MHGGGLLKPGSQNCIFRFVVWLRLHIVKTYIPKVHVVSLQDNPGCNP